MMVCAKDYVDGKIQGVNGALNGVNKRVDEVTNRVNSIPNLSKWTNVSVPSADRFSNIICKRCGPYVYLSFHFKEGRRKNKVLSGIPAPVLVCLTPSYINDEPKTNILKNNMVDMTYSDSDDSIASYPTGNYSILYLTSI